MEMRPGLTCVLKIVTGILLMSGLTVLALLVWYVWQFLKYPVGNLLAFAGAGVRNPRSDILFWLVVASVVVKDAFRSVRDTAKPTLLQAAVLLGLACYVVMYFGLGGSRVVAWLSSLMGPSVISGASVTLWKCNELRNVTADIGAGRFSGPPRPKGGSIWGLWGRAIAVVYLWLIGLSAASVASCAILTIAILSVTQERLLVAFLIAVGTSGIVVATTVSIVNASAPRRPTRKARRYS